MGAVLSAVGGALVSLLVASAETLGAFAAATGAALSTVNASLATWGVLDAVYIVTDVIPGVVPYSMPTYVTTFAGYAVSGASYTALAALGYTGLAVGLGTISALQFARAHQEQTNAEVSSNRRIVDYLPQPLIDYITSKEGRKSFPNLEFNIGLRNAATRRARVERLRSRNLFPNPKPPSRTIQSAEKTRKRTLNRTTSAGPSKRRKPQKKKTVKQVCCCFEDGRRKCPMHSTPVTVRTVRVQPGPSKKRKLLSRKNNSGSKRKRRNSVRKGRKTTKGRKVASKTKRLRGKSNK